MQKNDRNRNNRYNRQNNQPKKELTKEEKFELMLANWKKESKGKLHDLRKQENNKITETRYIVKKIQNEKKEGVDRI